MDRGSYDDWHAGVVSKPTRFNIGNGRVWAHAPIGWVEMPSVFDESKVALVPFGPSPIRCLEPDECERAERGLGPVETQEQRDKQHRPAWESVNFASPSAGCHAPSDAPAGLTPEQATRYQDAAAKMLRRLAMEVAEELFVAHVAHSACDESAKESRLATWAHVRNLHWELMEAAAAYVAYGFAPTELDGRSGAHWDEAKRRIADSLGGRS